MSIEKTGAVISHGIGVGLIVVAASSLLYLPIFQPSGMATSGWTSYSPNGTSTTTPDLTTHLHDTSYVISSIAAGYLPSAAHAAAGFVMILLSRPMGRWLAKGLSEGDTNDAA